MDEQVRTQPGDGTVAQVRERRGSLHSALVEVEQAIAAAAAGRTQEWSTRVRAALERLERRVDAHIEATEGPEGLFEDVVQRSPRLARACERLIAEHEEIRARLAAAMDSLDGEAGPARDAVMSLLALLARHRQRGADLVYEAYAVDLGGSD